MKINGRQKSSRLDLYVNNNFLCSEQGCGTSCYKGTPKLERISMKRTEMFFFFGRDKHGVIYMYFRKST